MSAGLSNQEASALVVVAFIVLIMARRTYRLASGTRYSTGRLFVFGGFSCFLFALFAYSTLYVAVGVWGITAVALCGAYAVAVVTPAWLAVPHVRRVAQFERREDGELYYRLPIVVPLISLALFLARLGVEVGLFGLATLATFALPTTLPVGSLIVLIAFDLMYGASVGLILGRGLGVRSAYARRPREPPPLP